MRLLKKQLCVALGCVLMAALPGASQADDTIYRIDLNKTQILRLPAPAGSIVVGNPAIADVTVHSPGLVMVVGRGFGETNLVILDRDGQTMVDADVQVTAITPSNGVRLFQAASRQTYTCAPYCQPSPTLGDSADHIAANSSQAEAAGTPSTIRDTDFSNFGTVSDVVSGRSLRGGP